MAQPALENLATNLRVLAALLNVSDLLRDLDPVVLKGPLLTERVYGNLSARPSADNDLWLPREQAQEALQRLKNAGYRPEPGVAPQERLLRVGQVALWPGGDFREVSVDVHIRPFKEPYFAVGDTLLERHRQRTTYQGRRLSTFDAELSLCHLAAHYVHHHLDDRLVPFLCDAYQSFHRQGLLTDVWPLAQKTHTARPLLLALSRRFAPAEASGLALPPLPVGVRLVGCVLPSLDQGERPREVVRKALSLALVFPHGLLPGIAQGLYPGREELLQRYGPGPLPLLSFRHVSRLLRGR